MNVISNPALAPGFFCPETPNSRAAVVKSDQIMASQPLPLPHKPGPITCGETAD
jgi:hypothetical protein